MKITIENTDRTVEANGVLCRVWEGASASGIPVVCLIPRIAVPEGHPQEEFVRELSETRAPSALADTFPLRMVL